MIKMAKATQKVSAFRAVDSIVLSSIVAAFKPEEIGLSRAWEEFYLACQAAEASHEFLRAIHDIKESIEDAERA